jgi:hypothetical protein
MADTVQGTGPANNGGERVEVSLKDRALRFNTKDAVSMVIVLILGAAMYFLTENITSNQLKGFMGMERIIEEGNQHQLAVLQKMGEYQGSLLEKMSAIQVTILDLVHVNREQITDQFSRQDTRSHAQTQTLQQMIDHSTELIGQKIDALGQKLTIHDLNMRQPPGEALPLDLPEALMPGRQEGQRSKAP